MGTKLPLLKLLHKNISPIKRIDLKVTQKEKPHTTETAIKTKLPIIESSLKPLTPYNPRLPALKINDKFSLATNSNRQKTLEFAKRIRFSALCNEEPDLATKKRENMVRKSERFKSLFLFN